MNLEDFIIDEIFGERLLISKNADQTEINDNIRVAYVLLSCFEASPDKETIKNIIYDVIEKLRT